MAHSLFSGFLSAVEIGLGTLLIVRRPGWITWAACLLLFAAFAGVSGYYAATGVPSCGCFGRLQVAPIWSLAIDLALIGAAAACPSSEVRWGRLGTCFAKIAVATSLATIVVAIMGVVLSPTRKEIAAGVVETQYQLILAPEKWVGHSLPIRAIVGPEAERLLHDGDWEVWIVNADCPKCDEALKRRFGQRHLAPVGRRLALIIDNNGTSNDNWAMQFTPGDSFVSLSPRNPLACNLPICIHCDGGVVVSVAGGITVN